MRKRLEWRIRMKKDKDSEGKICNTPTSLPCTADQPSINGDHSSDFEFINLCSGWTDGRTGLRRQGAW